MQAYVTLEMLGLDKQIFNMRIVCFAILELQKINFIYDPQKKLELLIRVMESLEKLFPHKVGADLLFPWVFWVTIFANVELLKQNLDFIRKTSEKQNLLGINGYVLSTFESILYLILNVNGQELLKYRLALVAKK